MVLFSEDFSFSRREAFCWKELASFWSLFISEFFIKISSLSSSFFLSRASSSELLANLSEVSSRAHDSCSI